MINQSFKLIKYISKLLKNANLINETINFIQKNEVIGTKKPDQYRITSPITATSTFPVNVRPTSSPSIGRYE